MKRLHRILTDLCRVLVTGIACDQNDINLATFSCYWRLTDLRLRPFRLLRGDVPGDADQLFRRHVVFRNRKVPNAGFNVKPSFADFVNLDFTR